MEELAEARLLQRHQEDEIIESEVESQQDVEAGDPGGGGRVEPQPVPGQLENAGERSGGGLVAPEEMAVQQEAGAVGGGEIQVPQVAAGDSTLDQTNFPPPAFCSGCGFIGTTSVQ